MKIYEVRDVSDDENYYTKGYFETAEEAIKHIDADFEDKLIGLCEYADEYRIVELIEIEVGKWDHEKGFNKTIYKKECSAFDDEETKEPSQ